MALPCQKSFHRCLIQYIISSQDQPIQPPFFFTGFSICTSPLKCPLNLTKKLSYNNVRSADTSCSVCFTAIQIIQSGYTELTAMSERNLGMGEWNNRRQWDMEAGRRRQTFQNRTYIHTELTFHCDCRDLERLALMFVELWKS